MVIIEFNGTQSRENRMAANPMVDHHLPCQITMIGIYPIFRSTHIATCIIYIYNMRVCIIYTYKCITYLYVYIYIQLYIQHISILPGSNCKFRVGYYFQWAQQATAVRTRPEAMMKVPQVEHAESVVLVLGSQGWHLAIKKWKLLVLPFDLPI